MRVAGVDLLCPVCHGELLRNDEELSCARCTRHFPVILGIPDLRVFPDPYIDMEADRDKARALAERFGEFDFRGLVEYYYRTTSVVTRGQAESFTRGLIGAVPRAESALEQWEGAAPSEPAATRLLEIGCGTAPLLIAAARRYNEQVGIDIALRWLMVGKKRLMEAGLDIPLICACAEALPFAPDSFDRVVADSVIENVSDQSRTMSEAYRVLRPGGRLFIATANRFSVGPDPQIGMWMTGFLPRRWVEARVRRQGALPPKRLLLSARGVAQLLRRSGFMRTRLSLPVFPPGQRAQLPAHVNALVGAYHAASRLPGTRHMLRLLGPKFSVVSEKGLPDGARANAGTA